MPFAAGKGISFRKLLIFPFSLIAVIFSWLIREGVVMHSRKIAGELKRTL